MNKMMLNKALVSSLLLALMLSACKSTPVAESTPVEDKSATQSSAPAADSSAADTSGVKEVAIDGNASKGLSPLTDPNNILSKRNIYFDFDSDAIKAEFRPLIEAHAKYLLANGSAKVSLLGNTDERGTREYNLSLGQRRSVAVKKALNLLGVSDAQIETVSYGEEKATACADEACYKTNRRTDIAYAGE
jgi:peptidoglycan-associated lipoprotein